MDELGDAGEESLTNQQSSFANHAFSFPAASRSRAPCRSGFETDLNFTQAKTNSGGPRLPRKRTERGSR